MSIGMMAGFSFNLSSWILMHIAHHSTSAYRSPFLDVYRGLAVLLMMIFHLCWDLRHFGFIHYNLHDPFWVDFRSLILTLFLTAIGWSAYLTSEKTSKHRLISWKRDSKLFISACVISLATYLALPDQWIYFGILHFILVASFIIRPLARWPIACALFGSLILLVYQTTTWLEFPNAFAVLSRYVSLPEKTLDIVFPFPWIGVVFLGPLLGYLQWHQLKWPPRLFPNILAFMGRHALTIYLSHQLILFTLVAVVKMTLLHFS